ncbi:TPA: NAD(P)/FAD-dependent oxidoreductase [Patescibacteria group bacterium]|uniref:Ferredoxin--NADP reductase n=1 Tax=Candidatus Gottesmanbacteria bacterium GW2011_GWA1_43_11 TaxID=1618436 RepID=A0A0G1CF60_9BACT|nr:MAG: Thioredoxin reductase [Candidatus Gottesmanbacteria bacterium GW2011_GWA1_43_11]HCS78308.1 NAD(P)/FAD-dependent oxidoreductase [Patescibacteria group bacterium]
MDSYDLIIIGAGPAGLAASIYALERKLRTLVLEANGIGGQPMQLYADKKIYDFPSYSEITGKELANKMYEQARKFGVVIEVAAASSIMHADSYFQVKTVLITYQTRSVILATGLGYFKPRQLGIPGENDLTGKGVFYKGIPEKLIGKRLIVVGGGDTALETAVAAAEKGGSVSLVHRHDSFRAVEKTVEKARSLGVQFYLNSIVSEIHGIDRVESIKIVKGGTAESLLTTDYIGICIGAEIDRTFLQNLGVSVENQAVKVDADMQSSIPGMFACGDVATQAGKYKRISVAVGTAATAVNGVYQFLKNPYWGRK